MLPLGTDDRILRHGAYICLDVDAARRSPVRSALVDELVAQHALANEHNVQNGHPEHAIGFLRRADAVPGDIDDGALLRAGAVVHVASADGERVRQFCNAFEGIVGQECVSRVLTGVVRPTLYTSATMFAFAYAAQVTQAPARVMPNAFLVPMRKTSAWWSKDWVERHTYFLPRYDEQGRMTHKGHALAAAAGIPCLLRRTYKHQTLPAPADEYEFLNYFECADAGVPVFQAVRAALRDPAENPEWRFVREGPTWHGLRVPDWGALMADTTPQTGG